MASDARLRIIIIGGAAFAGMLIWLAQYNSNPQPIMATQVRASGVLDWDIDHAIQIKDEDREWFRAAAFKSTER
jgi:hypothetical protein